MNIKKVLCSALLITTLILLIPHAIAGTLQTENNMWIGKTIIYKADYPQTLLHTTHTFKETEIAVFETKIWYFQNNNISPVPYYIKLYIDDEIVAAKQLQSPSYNIDDYEEIDFSIKFDFSIDQKLLSAGQHTFKTEIIAPESINTITDDDILIKNFEVWPGDFENILPISPDEQLWRGLVRGSDDYYFMNGGDEDLEGALISINEGEYETTTDKDGRWFISLPVDKVYTMKVSKSGYFSRSLNLEDTESYYTFAKLYRVDINNPWLPAELDIDTKKPENYDINQLYTDVTEKDWYTLYVKDLISENILRGEAVEGEQKLQLNAGENLRRVDVIKILGQIHGGSKIWEQNLDPEIVLTDGNKKFFYDEEYSSGDYILFAKYLYRQGFLKGNPPSYDKSDSLPILDAFNEINRVEALALIYRVFHNIEISELEEIDVSMFPDVSNDDWFAPLVAQGVTDGIITGHPDGTFRPGDTVNFVEFAAMYSRMKNSISE